MNTYCICGRNSKDDPWEILDNEFPSFDAAYNAFMEATQWFPNYREFYIDREDSNDRHIMFLDRQKDGTFREVSP